MKRKKTRPPQATGGEIAEIWAQLRQLPPSEPKCYRAAEAARAVYDKAEELYQQFPQDAEVSNAYIDAQQHYWQRIREAYSPEFVRGLNLLRAGDVSGLESIVAFLEADPIFYGTGYLKEDLSRLLRAVELPTNYIQRLQTVVLRIVDHRDGRDFRAYCRLARKVDSSELREQLSRRLAHADMNVRRRAKWVLEALAQKDTQG